MVNAAFASRSYLELQDVNILAALVTYLMRLASQGPTVTGQMASAVSSGKALMGRCFDLSKAYKQIAVSQSKSGLKHAVLGARDSRAMVQMATPPWSGKQLEPSPRDWYPSFSSYLGGGMQCLGKVGNKQERLDRIGRMV